MNVIKKSNRYFWKIENFAYGEINERGFSNPHPGSAGLRNPWDEGLCAMNCLLQYQNNGNEDDQSDCDDI